MLCMNLGARLCSYGALKPLLLSSTRNANSGLQTVRLFTNESRSSGSGFARHAARRRRTLADMTKSAESATSSTKAIKAFNIGQGALAGFSVLGMGALCYYGLGLSSERGAIDKQFMWPQYVKDRIKSTYSYFGASIGLTAASAISIFRTPFLLNIVARQGFIALGVSIAAVIGSGMLVRSIPYTPGFGKKQMAWLLHTGIIGATMAPICFLGGPIIARAAWYTAGMVGGLSVVSVCAPSEKFLKMGGPLAMGLGTIFLASIGSAFLPPTSVVGASLYSLALYGGLIVFGGFMLYDTQKIVYKAENYPPIHVYDPINASIEIYLSTINIFIRMAQILAMGGGSRRK